MGISENYLSRSFTLGAQAVRELIYEIDAADDVTAQALLAAAAPRSYGGLTLDSLNADPVSGTHWKGYARYVVPENGSEFTFDTTGGTKHVTQSLATVARYARDGEEAPDFNGAIGVSEDRVEGTDVPERKYEFSETHYLDDDQVTGDYKRTLFLMTGRWNDADFKGLAAGECLFLGASGSKRGNEKWAITYRFSGSENVFGMTIGAVTVEPYGDPLDEGYYAAYDDTIKGIDKLGWDYLWVRYEDFSDDPSKTLVKRPTAAYVERVLEPGDFSLLGIGVD